MPSHIIDFRDAETFAETAKFIGLVPALLKLAISASHNPDQQQASFYVRHNIPKKSGVPGEFRVVWDIKFPQIRDAHRALAWRFDDFAKHVVQGFPHPSAFGYVRGRGIRGNAYEHRGTRRILHCDLKDFFATITKDRLVAFFRQIGIQAEPAEALASFVTIEGSLALGFNASPTLANLLCLGLDQKLSLLAKAHACKYTRYADDITVSGDDPPKAETISDIAEAEGFTLATRKTRTTVLGQAHFVTGLSVSDSKGPRVPRNFKKRLRQELYYSRKFGIAGHLVKADSDRSYQKGINRIDGSVRFLSSIEPDLGTRMRQDWREILTRNSARVSYTPVDDKSDVHATFLVDESEFEKDGRKFLALGCVTTEHIAKVRDTTEVCLREYLVDPFTSGRKDILKNKKLHFSDAPEALRSAYIALLPYLPFRAYIAFSELMANRSYSDVYKSLLSELLPRRLKSYDRASVTIVLEKNPRIRATEVISLVSQIYGELDLRNERRPATPPGCELKGKLDEPAFSLPDCLLSVFTRAFGTRVKTEIDYLHFERLRAKYRHIINLSTGQLYSRRHPIEMRPGRLTAT